MSEQAGEKQHQASSKRIADLRREGQIMRSKDLTSGMVFIATVFALLYTATQIKYQLEENFVAAFNAIKLVMHTNGFEHGVLQQIILKNFLVLLPIFGVVICASLLSPFLFGGWNFSWHTIRVKSDSLNPINNLKNIFSIKLVKNIIKSMLKVGLILGVLSIYAYYQRQQINMLVNLPIHTAVAAGASMVGKFIIILSLSLVLIMGYDALVTFFEFQKKIKMTTQELKDEHKDTEGNADTKRRVRSAQFALLKQRLTISVPKATVIITNPTHYAVAVRYEAGKDKAPRVLAKGKGFLAQQIRQLAIANGVPIYQAPILARALFNTTKLGAEVDPALYMGVAIVLSYIHQLKNYQYGLGNQPQMVTDLKVPPEFVYNE